MTNQEAFTKAYWHLKKQNRKSNSGQTCLYAGPDNTACAVGCLLPRELCERLRDRNPSAFRLMEDDPEARDLLSGCDVSFLQALQHAHDYALEDNFWAQCRANLRGVAQHYDLEMPE